MSTYVVSKAAARDLDAFVVRTCIAVPVRLLHDNLREDDASHVHLQICDESCNGLANHPQLFHLARLSALLRRLFSVMPLNVFVSLCS